MTLIKRKKTRQITIGNKKIGADNPILVQSMTKSKIDDIEEIKREIKDLIACGCEVIRVAITDEDSIYRLKKLIDEKVFTVPLVADIQFDYDHALKSLDIGVDCIRINPGNIGSNQKVAQIIKKAKDKKSCIRIGVNSGSIDKKLLEKTKQDHAAAMVESVLEYVRFFEKMQFYNFKISAKASSVMDTIYVYKSISDKIDYPLHLGVTEAGSRFKGAIKSSVGIGNLLYMGIGDTIRVSLTDLSVSEVEAGYTILNSLNLREYGVDIISCPTCGRTKVDLREILKKVEESTMDIPEGLKIAVMGCIVNGPGEAKDADLGIAFGNKKCALFVKGKVIKRIECDRVLEEFKIALQKFK